MPRTQGKEEDTPSKDCRSFMEGHTVGDIDRSCLCGTLALSRLYAKQDASAQEAIILLAKDIMGDLLRRYPAARLSKSSAFNTFIRRLDEVEGDE